MTENSPVYMQLNLGITSSDLTASPNSLKQIGETQYKGRNFDFVVCKTIMSQGRQGNAPLGEIVIDGQKILPVVPPRNYYFIVYRKGRQVITRDLNPSDRLLGMFNSMGFPTKPPSERVKEIRKTLKLYKKNGLKTQILVSVYDMDPLIAAQLGRYVVKEVSNYPNFGGLILDISCPHVNTGTGCADRKLTNKYILETREVAGKDVPILVKIAPKHYASQRSLEAVESGVDGVVLTNTLSVVPFTEQEHEGNLYTIPILSYGKGGVSGPLLKMITREIVENTRNTLDSHGHKDAHIIATGGVSNRADALDLYNAGAPYVGVTTLLWELVLKKVTNPYQTCLKRLMTDQPDNFSERQLKHKMSLLFYRTWLGNDGPIFLRYDPQGKMNIVSKETYARRGVIHLRRPIKRKDSTGVLGFEYSTYPT